MFSVTNSTYHIRKNKSKRWCLRYTKRSMLRISSYLLSLPACLAFSVSLCIFRICSISTNMCSTVVAMVKLNSPCVFVNTDNPPKSPVVYFFDNFFDSKGVKKKSIQRKRMHKSANFRWKLGIEDSHFDQKCRRLTKRRQQ